MLGLTNGTRAKHGPIGMNQKPTAAFMRSSGAKVKEEKENMAVRAIRELETMPSARSVRVPITLPPTVRADSNQEKVGLLQNAGIVVKLDIEKINAREKERAL